MKSIKWAIALCLITGAVILAGCSAEQSAIRKLSIGSPDVSAIADGSYEGRFAYGGFEYAVLVRMAAGRIEAIDIIANRATTHAKSAEGVIPRILERQTPKVDAVSGSTTTSKALMKAAENALESAPRR